MLPVTNYCEIHNEYHFCNGATPMTTNNPLDTFRQAANRALDGADFDHDPNCAFMSGCTCDQEARLSATLAALEAAAIELVNNELTDFWTSLTPDENIMRAAENYQKFCDRINALGDSHDHQ